MSKNKKEATTATATLKQVPVPVFTWPTDVPQKITPPTYFIVICAILLVTIVIVAYPLEILSILNWLAERILILLIDFSGWLSRTFLGGTW